MKFANNDLRWKWSTLTQSAIPPKIVRPRSTNSATPPNSFFAIGGKNSNNTAQLARTARKLGCKAYHIEAPNDIKPEWLDGIRKIGVTAGTSTLDESLEAVVLHLQALAKTQKSFTKQLSKAS